MLIHMYEPPYSDLWLISCKSGEPITHFKTSTHTHTHTHAGDGDLQRADHTHTHTHQNTMFLKMLYVNEEQLCSFPEVVMRAVQNKRGGYPGCVCTQTHWHFFDLPGIHVNKKNKKYHKLKKKVEYVVCMLNNVVSVQTCLQEAVLI